MTSEALEVFGVGTARTFRVHWMLHELGLAHTVHPIESRSGETQEADFLELNPRGKIPVLRHGDLVLAESAAIVGYLAEQFSGKERLIPAPGSRERALYDQWAFWILTELVAHTLCVLRRHGDLANLYGEALSEVLEAYRLRLASRSAYPRASEAHFPPEVRAALAGSRDG